MFDPVELEVFRNIFTSITEEMGTVLKLSAFSPNIKERRDYSAALFTSDAESFALGAHIPVHLGAMPYSVRSALKAVNVEEGDTVILNDPYLGGTHLPDITMISPVFYKGKSVFFVANRAHHADVGGMQPGSMPLAEEIFQEGLIIPPVKIEEKGNLRKDILKFILSNCRNQEEREADIKAQIAANRKGTIRLKELLEKRGEKVIEYSHHLVEYSRVILEKKIQRLPEGKFCFEDFLDDDGSGNENIPIKVCIKKIDGVLNVDFTGTAPQTKGGMNANPAIVASALLYVVKTAIGKELPVNSGLLKPIKLRIPEGNLLNPKKPAAVAAGNVETSQRIVDVLFGALSKMIPEKAVAASQGTMNNVSFGGEGFAYYETIGGGAGATSQENGASGVHTHMTNSLNTPVEVIEQGMPVEIRKYELRKGSGGYGKHRGGDGIIREYRFKKSARISILSERRRHAPYGIFGGKSGKIGKNFIIKKGKKFELRSKVNISVEKGDILIIETPGGGGYGEKA